MAGAQAAWGLDVGITSLKAMKLRKDGDKVAVEAFEVIEHDKFLSEPDIDRDELIRHSVRKFLERNQVKGEAIFVGVPGSSTFARFVKLPPVDPKKIPEIVRFEAIQQIPFPLDQVNWDYQTFLSPESPDVEVGIFAMKKELVGQVLANFRASGLTVHGVQMSPLAVYNAAAYDGMTDGKGTVLIDMGAEHTDLVIMDQGRLWLRTINIGGNHFTDALAKSFKQPFSRAESLKKSAATSKYQKQIFQAMRPIFADLVAEIQRSIGHYNSSHRDSKLERIVGMGNPFKLPNLQKYLQQELKMEVIRLDNFRKVNADGKLAAGLNEAILSMTAAYGLAVQGLGLASIDTNLLPIEIARQMMWRSKRPYFVGVAACMVAALAMWQTQYWLSQKAFASPQTEDRRTRNDSAIADATRKKNEFGALGNTFSADKDKVDAFLKLADDRSIWPSLSLDFIAGLPQAAGSKNTGRPAASMPAVRSIVITAINSDYSSKLTASVAATPMPMMSNNPDDPNMPVMPGPPMQGTVTVVPGVAAAPGESDRGFLVTITGYVEPGANANEEGYDVVNKYGEALVSLAPKKGNKPYYIADPKYTGETIPSVSGTTAPPPSALVWGNAKGPFWDVFAADVAGVKLEEKIGAGGQVETPTLGTLGAIDLFAPKLPTGPQPMTGCFTFTLKLKVFIRDKSPAAGAPGGGH